MLSCKSRIVSICKVGFVFNTMINQHFANITKLATTLHLSQDVGAGYRNNTNSGFQYPEVAENASRVFVQSPSEKKSSGFTMDLFWGGLSAVVAKIIEAKVDSKMMEKEDESKSLSKRIRYWRTTVHVIRYVPTQAHNFAFKEQFNTLFSIKKEDGYCKWVAGNLWSGGAAGASTLLLTNSFDNNAKKGLVDVNGKTPASNGIVGQHRRFNMSCLGVIVYRSLYFGMFDSLKPVLPGSLKDNFYVTLILAVVATGGASLASYPIDTIHKRMMMTPYKSSLAAFTQILKNEGAKSLFKGFGTNYVPIFTATGVLVFYNRLPQFV